MILVDSRVGSRELLPLIKQLGVKAELSELEYGDFCCNGNGPKGQICIGIERKTLSDILQCIDDARYAAYQRPGMARMYDKSILMIEGSWRPREDGILMELFRGLKWGECRYRSQRVMYSKLYRYLLSMTMGGVIITYSRDMEHTAFNVCEIFHYFSKKWEDHTSLIELQTLNIPDMRGKPTLVRKWAAQITGVGVKLSQEAETYFKKPLVLANSSESDWIKLPQVGAKTAMQIIREIRGVK